MLTATTWSTGATVSTSAAFLGVLIAIFTDWKGLGTKAIGNRVASAFVLVATITFIDGTFAERWVINGAEWCTKQAGTLLTRWGMEGFGDEISRNGVGWAVLCLAALWIAAMMPKRLAKFPLIGAIANEEYGSWMIWLGTPILALTAGAIPGSVGDGVAWLLSGIAGAAGTILTWAMTGF